MLVFLRARGFSWSLEVFRRGLRRFLQSQSKIHIVIQSGSWTGSNSYEFEIRGTIWISTYIISSGSWSCFVFSSHHYTVSTLYVDCCADLYCKKCAFCTWCTMIAQFKIVRLSDSNEKRMFFICFFFINSKNFLRMLTWTPQLSVNQWKSRMFPALSHIFSSSLAPPARFLNLNLSSLYNRSLVRGLEKRMHSTNNVKNIYSDNANKFREFSKHFYFQKFLRWAEILIL